MRHRWRSDVADRRTMQFEPSVRDELRTVCMETRTAEQKNTPFAVIALGLLEL